MLGLREPIQDERHTVGLRESMPGPVGPMPGLREPTQGVKHILKDWGGGGLYLVYARSMPGPVTHARSGEANARSVTDSGPGRACAGIERPLPSLRGAVQDVRRKLQVWNLGGPTCISQCRARARPDRALLAFSFNKTLFTRDGLRLSASAFLIYTTEM